MHLHLGSGTAVNLRDVVAIFDMDNTTVSKSTRKFLTQAQQDGLVSGCGEDLPKSYVVTEKNGKIRVYLSPISPTTLLKRSNKE